MVYEKFPLKNLLKGKLLKIAELQDKLVIELSSKFEIVLHGGTAIWRIYGGRRFSFDVDLYHKNPSQVLKHFKTSGVFTIVRSKLTGSNVLYARFQEDDTLVEINVSPVFKALPTTDGEFYLVDGNSIILRTLSPTELLKEKVIAFKNRGKARDLYDIFYLLDIADTREVRNEVKTLLPLLKKSPKDFQGLKELILVGKAPDFETIVKKVRKYAKD